MSSITTSNKIVDEMKTAWTTDPKIDGGFYFGWPQEVDNVHSKKLPLMVLNPPQMTISTTAFNSNTILINSNWTLTAYKLNDTASTDYLDILDLWDGLEDDVLSWFYIWWYEFADEGNDFVMTAPIQITRIKEASNDRLLGLKITFGFNFYRYCNEV